MAWMRYTLVISMFFITVTLCVGQFGAGVKYQSISSGFWDEAFAMSQSASFNGNMAGASAYYWLRLEDVRVEFLPEVGYMLSFAHDENALTSRIRTIPLLINTDIYLFDLLDDCDCPTFSKQGTFVQRGFFVEVSGGVDFQTLELENATQETIFDVSENIWRAGLGIGLDIGVSDLVTITPTAFMHWHSTPDWQGLPEALGIERTSVSATGGDWYRGFAVRAIFRPDYTRRNRY